MACLALLDGRDLGPAVAEAAQLLATVVGQDLEESSDGTFRIARRVAPDRVISTVDPEARHGHKTANRGFDGYKGHVALDPDSEVITNTAVTPANDGDATVAEELIVDLLDGDGATGTDTAVGCAGEAGTAGAEVGAVGADGAPTVYGDNVYGTGEFQSRLEGAQIDSRCKTQAPTAAGGLFTKDRFHIDLEAGTVACPNGVRVEVRRYKDGSGMAYFGGACTHCPVRGQCTTASGGRTIGISRHEEALARARARQADPAWVADYRATRPKVERKLGHLMRRNHGGRRARVRGTRKVGADFNLLAAAQNLARLAALGLRSVGGRWEVVTA